MINYPTYTIVNNNKYRINTDYKVAIECNEIAESDISDEERAMVIIYKLFGDKGLNNPQDWNKLIERAVKYLKCGKENKKIENNEEADMDFQQDWEYIRTSFFYDYKIRLKKNKYMHWWEFYNLLCGLSDKCILNRVRFVRNFDIGQIKSEKERNEWIKQKEAVELKKKAKPKDKRLDDLFEQQLKGR